MECLKKLRHFICQPSQPLLKRIAHIFALLVFVLAGIFFCYYLSESICFSLSFPNGSTLEGSVWMIQISLLFLFLWMPGIIFLMKFFMTSKVAVGIYIVGCILAIILSIVSTVIMNKYLEAGAVRDEYQKLVNKCIKDNNRLPKAVLFIVDSEECCGWKGAIDFGVSFKLSDKVEKEYDFMKEVEKCYGGTWKVRKGSKGALEYEDGAKSYETMPKGCNLFYKQLFHRNCLLIFYFGLVVDILSLVFIVFCILLYKSAKTASATVSPSEPELEDEALQKDSKKTPTPSAISVENPHASAPVDPTN